MRFKQKCCREGCNSDHCTRHNPKIGYLCEECFDNFIDYLVGVDFYIKSEDDFLLRYLKAFVRHPKTFKFSNRYTPIVMSEKIADEAFPRVER
jgi:hypothetical protein